jgi:hypothetical protein
METCRRSLSESRRDHLRCRTGNGRLGNGDYSTDGYGLGRHKGRPYARRAYLPPNGVCRVAVAASRPRAPAIPKQRASVPERASWITDTRDLVHRIARVTFPIRATW